MQRSVPAVWPAFAGWEFHPLDHIEKFQFHLVPPPFAPSPPPGLRLAQSSYLQGHIAPGMGGDRGFRHRKFPGDHPSPAPNDRPVGGSISSLAAGRCRRERIRPDDRANSGIRIYLTGSGKSAGCRSVTGSGQESRKIQKIYKNVEIYVTIAGYGIDNAPRIIGNGIIRHGSKWFFITLQGRSRAMSRRQEALDHRPATDVLAVNRAC